MISVISNKIPKVRQHPIFDVPILTNEGRESYHVHCLRFVVHSPHYILTMQQPTLLSLTKAREKRFKESEDRSRTTLLNLRAIESLVIKSEYDCISQHGQNYIESLPPEIVLHIFLSLNRFDLALLSMTSKTLKFFVENDVVWQSLAIRRWPFLPKEQFKPWRKVFQEMASACDILFDSKIRYQQEFVEAAKVIFFFSPFSFFFFFIF